MKEPLKIIFAGTPEFAAKHLSTLLETNHQIVAVITQQDKVVGRGNKIQFTPVKEIAMQHSIPVYQFKSLKDQEIQNILNKYNSDLMVVVAYGIIIPKAILALPKFGCINVHGSLLPSWRGAAPIQRSIEAGDKETGICIMKMDVGLDTGPVYQIEKTLITKTDDSLSIFAKLSKLGCKALIEVINQIETIKPKTQEELTSQFGWELSYAHKLDKAEGLIDPSNFTADQIERKTRAFISWPSVYIDIQLNGNFTRIKILKSDVISQITENCTEREMYYFNKKSFILKCAKQTYLSINVIQLPCKKPMTIDAFINGYKQII